MGDRIHKLYARELEEKREELLDTLKAAGREPNAKEADWLKIVAEKIERYRAESPI